MTIRHTLATRIRELMDARATLDTQTKLAVKSGVGQSTIQRILAEEASATIDTVEAIAQAFGVAPVVLLSTSHRDETLLNLWCQLNKTNHARVLSFAQVAIESDKSAVRQIEISRTKQLSPGAIDSIREASSAPPQPPIVAPHTEQTNARRVGGRG